MDRLIRITTEKFLKKLDENREYFTPEQLLEAGLPDFLVNRIRLELIRNLQDSVRPPESDWANMNTDAVQDSWDQFLQAIHEEIRLPGSYANSVLETSLGDILELMVTPRAFLPDYMFGSESELKLETVKARSEWIVIYRYFATTIPRFMEKKGRDVLTREQADRIIERLDERVTANYTSLNWGQLFEPWFILLGDTIDPALFAKFFRDKGKPGVARLFDAEADPIHRTRLIEILSKPQFENEDDDLADVGLDFPEKDTAGEPAGDNTVGKSQISSDSQKPDSSELPKPKEASEEDRKERARLEENIMARFQKSDGDDDDEPLYSRLKRDDTGESDDDEENRPLYSRIKPKQEDDEAEDVPIWQRFSEVRPDDDELADHRKPSSLLGSESPSKEEPASPAGSKPAFKPESGNASSSGSKTVTDTASGSGKNDSRDDGMTIIDVSGEDEKQSDSAEILEEIRIHVKDMEKVFVSELFGGDENAYLEALEEISKYDEWKGAGSYISKNIFDRNMIDIYSDPAIDFTDRMQTYFLERQNR